MFDLECKLLYFLHNFFVSYPFSTIHISKRPYSDYIQNSTMLESQIMNFTEVSGPISWLADYISSKSFQTLIFVYCMFLNSDCFEILRMHLLDFRNMFSQFMCYLNMFCLVLIIMLA